jgi:metallo-beta-lactamase family protein
VSIKLNFLGAAGTVTGSKYLLENGSQRLLIDCGLFQGKRELREANWARFPVDPASISAVVLTHAHLDHCGYLPALVKSGFRGDVLCSEATADLCEILLRDAGHLQESDARFANRHGFSRHKPALPLYTVEDAEATLRQLRTVPFHQDQTLPGGAQLRLVRAGHILGAASLKLEWGGVSILFSGDLGRFNDPLMVDPEPRPASQFLVVESTYGDRRHPQSDPQSELEDIVSRTVRRGGTVVVPAFAVGRAQNLLFYFARLKAAGKLANVPIFLDSPMAVNASEIFCHHRKDHKLSEPDCRNSCNVATYMRSVEDSKRLSAMTIPKVIISASGMATGGRVLHHLKRLAPDPKSTILFAGYQARGTRGAAMTAGATTIRIHGEDIPVRAEVKNISALSAHADAEEIMAWLKTGNAAPRMTFITHGEPAASNALRSRIENELGWGATVPAQMEVVTLSQTEPVSIARGARS